MARDEKNVDARDEKNVDAALEHTRGGVHTRDGADAGVPMLAGSADEPVGPEDAYGRGPKRGDYTGRVDQGPHLISELIPEEERVPGGPISRLVNAVTGEVVG